MDGDHGVRRAGHTQILDRGARLLWPIRSLSCFEVPLQFAHSDELQPTQCGPGGVGWRWEALGSGKPPFSLLHPCPNTSWMRKMCCFGLPSCNRLVISFLSTFLCCCPKLCYAMLCYAMLYYAQ